MQMILSVWQKIIDTNEKHGNIKTLLHFLDTILMTFNNWSNKFQKLQEIKSKKLIAQTAKSQFI